MVGPNSLSAFMIPSRPEQTPNRITYIHHLILSVRPRMLTQNGEDHMISYAVYRLVWTAERT